MFDQQDYYSQEEDNLHLSRHIVSQKILVQNSGSDFNHLTGQGESLLKMMQQRGLDINQNQLKKLKNNNSQKDKQQIKTKQKAGFIDGGASASYQQLLKYLNKALSSADPQQASVILSHILQKKGLSESDRNKFGVMKCKILFGIGSYQDCLGKAQQILPRVSNDHLVSSAVCNYIAKSKLQLNHVLEGYMDLLRAKAHMQVYKLKAPQINHEVDQFADSQIDSVSRQIEHSQMEYNIKMTKFKLTKNLVHPYFSFFRHRQVIKVVTGDHHALFLIGGQFGQKSSFQVFGMGQNSVGQVLGRVTQQIKQPTLIVQLSGKSITGIAATRESSLAWDDTGKIYEWGIKQVRNQQINVTYQLKQKIVQLQKGYQQYAAIGASGKFYTWGNMSFKGANVFKQLTPYVQPGQNIVSIACGTNHIIAVDNYGDVFALGSNQFGQLGLQAELHAKIFKKVSNMWIGKVRKVYAIGDATFFISEDQELFFCGKISHQKPAIQKIRQGQFTGQIRYITSMSGNIGNYYVTTSEGQLYRWQVDNSVKFKLQKQNQKISQRAIASYRGNIFKVRSLIVPELTKVKYLTSQAKSYEDIQFQLMLNDRYGPYASSNFVISPRCQIFLSTYAIKLDDLLKQNKQFLDSYQFSGEQTKIMLNQIIQNRLINFTITRNQQKLQYFTLKINSQQSGKFYFYILLQNTLIHSQQLKISVSQKEQQLSQKNKQQKLMKEQERKRKAQLQKQRLLQQKLKKQSEQQQKRKQTQRRAQQAYKKHLRQQQQIKSKAQQQRKARKQLMTGGGFDLNKLKAKNEKQKQKQKQKIIVQNQKQKSQKLIQNTQKIFQKPQPQFFQRTSDPMLKSGQRFLPDINTRPSSKRKINLTTKNSMTLSNFDSAKISQKNILKPDEFMGTNVNLFKSESIKQKQVKPIVSTKGQSLNKTGTISGGKVLVKRGLSNNKKK